MFCVCVVKHFVQRYVKCTRQDIGDVAFKGQLRMQVLSFVSENSTKNPPMYKAITLRNRW